MTDKIYVCHPTCINACIKCAPEGDQIVCVRECNSEERKVQAEIYNRYAAAGKNRLWKG